jgi:hypothetical protein
MAVGMGGAQSSDAGVVYTPLDVDIPVPEVDAGQYRIDFDGDGAFEFDIQQFDTITKVADIAPGVGILRNDDSGRPANVPDGTLIGSATGLFSGSGPDALNGIDNGAVDGPEVGHFQVSDGPGFIGVEFVIGGNFHYGYVGYEGTGEENDPTGHIFAMAYEDTPGAGIEAGAGIPALTADFDLDGDVDGADFLNWQQGLGTTRTAADLANWRAQFGQGGATGAASATPEPGSLALLATGAAGVGLYRRRKPQ